MKKIFLKTCNSLLFQDENGNRLDVNQFFSTSPKQYILCREMQRKPIIKCKGIKRSLVEKNITSQTFEDVTRNKKKSKDVVQYTLKKKDRQIYLTSSTKRALSKFTAKRYFSDAYSNNSQYFGYPVHLHSILE